MILPQNDDELQRLPFGRWACLFAILIVEFVALSLRYDSRVLDGDRALSGLIMHAGAVARVGIAMGLTTLFIVGHGCHGLLKREAKRLGQWPSWMAALAGNLLAFVSFYSLSGLVLEGPRSSYCDRALVVSWGLSGLATLVFWAMAGLPVSLWFSIARQSGWALAVGPALGAIAYLFGLFAQDQWKTLSYATLLLVDWMLKWVFQSVICEPSMELVGTSSFQVTIAPQCSGYEGMGLITVLLGVSLWLFRREFRFPRSFVLLPVGIVVIWLANAVRIATLIAIGTWGYPELAQGGFHSLAGWVSFLLIGLGLIAGAKSSSFFATASNKEIDDDLSPPRLDGAYLVPAMTIIATAMVTTSLSPGFDLHYPARVIIALIALMFYRKSYAELRPTWSWEACGVGAGVFAFWMALEPAGTAFPGVTSTPAALDSLGPAWSTTWLFFRVIGSVITVPVAEELAFRGYMTRRLNNIDFQSIPPGRMNWWSLLLSSCLFGALHGRWFAGTLAGMAYALAYRRRGELMDAILAHAVTNGLIAVMVLTRGDWWLWS